MGNFSPVSISYKLGVGLSLLAMLLLSSCGVNDATGRSQFNIVSEEEELKIGAQADKVIRQQYGVYPDADLQNYVDQIGQRIVAVSGRNDIPYYFTVVDSPILNAFALPGGYIYVTRGLLYNMNSESELAFVIGHEISHVAAKHGAQALSKRRGIIAASVLASLVFKKGADKYSDWVNLGVGLAVQGYGRENEFEADEFGVQYAYDAQYHPEAYTDFFETLLDRQTRTPSWMEGLLASHPPTDERIAYVKEDVSALIARDNPDLSTFTLNQQSYLKKIEGIAIGDGPSIGKVDKDDLYYNDIFAFEFKLPKKWRITESDSVSSLFELDDPDFPSKIEVFAAYHPTAISLEEHVKLYDSKPHRKRRVTLTQYSQKMTQSIHILPNEDEHHQYQISTYIVNEHYSYRVIASASKNDSENLKVMVDSFLEKLVFLTQKQVEDEGVYRLKLHQVKQGETLESIAKIYYPKLKDAAEDFRVVNNLENKTLIVGNWIKVPIIIDER